MLIVARDYHTQSFHEMTAGKILASTCNWCLVNLFGEFFWRRGWESDSHAALMALNLLILSSSRTAKNAKNARTVHVLVTATHVVDWAVSAVFCHNNVVDCRSLLLPQILVETPMEEELLEMAASWKQTAKEMIGKSENGSRSERSTKCCLRAQKCWSGW